MHITQGLQQVQPQCSIVLLHDYLLVSMLSTQSTLARLHDEALRLVGLQADDTPFLLLTNHRDSYNQLIQQLSPSNPHNLQALSLAIAAVNLSHLRQPPTSTQTLGRSTMPPPTTAATLEAFWSYITTASKQRHTFVHVLLAVHKRPETQKKRMLATNRIERSKEKQSNPKNLEVAFTADFRQPFISYGCLRICSCALRAPFCWGLTVWLKLVLLATSVKLAVPHVQSRLVSQVIPFPRCDHALRGTGWTLNTTHC